MEIILAIVVASAVIFFGVLISIGNERQRKAIDQLRDQMVLWAVQDLKIKREHLAQGIHVNDPLQWLSQIVSRVTANFAILEVDNYFDDPQALVCHSQAGGRFVLTPLSPATLRQRLNLSRNRLARYNENNPLGLIPKGAETLEISVLNCGVMFDLELPLAWKALTGQPADHIDRLWLYLLPLDA